MIKQENKLNKRTQLSNDQVYSLQTVLKMSNISDFLFGQIFYQTNQLSAVDNTESDVTVSNEKKKINQLDTKSKTHKRRVRDHRN